MSIKPEKAFTTPENAERDDQKYNKVKSHYIWERRPAFRDIKYPPIILKCFSIAGMCVFTLILSYLTGNSPLISVSFSILISVTYMIVFSSGIFLRLKGIKHLGLRRIGIFNNINFRIKDLDSDSIYIFNKSDRIVTGLKIFKIDIIPENVEGNITQFLRLLSRNGVPYTYQIVQTPNIQLFDEASDFYGKKEKINVRNRLINTQTSFTTSLYIATSYCNKVFLNSYKIKEIQAMLNSYSRQISASFTANFAHYHLKELMGLELVEGVYSIFFNAKIKPNDNDYSLVKKNNENLVSTFIKSAFIGFFLILSVVAALKISAYLIIIALGIIASIILSTWNEIFGPVINKTCFKEYFLLNLFNDYEFFTRSGVPETLFVWNKRMKLLIGTKILAIKYILDNGYCDPDKFIRAISPFKLSFTYSTIQAPINSYRNYMKYFNDRTQETLFKNYNTVDKDRQWLSKKAGIWKNIFVLSTNSYQFSPYITSALLDQVEEDLQIKFQELETAFGQFYHDYKTFPLTRKKLVLGFQVVTLKNKFIRSSGTYLYYNLIQGVVLDKVNKTMAELKKGITSKIPAEFNSPINIENDIIVGNTINTEFLEDEIPFGFTIEQTKNLIISGGTHDGRDDIAMRIVTELIKNRTPSIIFDFHGNYSKLIGMFSKTQYRKDIFYFKLGQSFVIKLLKSDIKQDPNNTEYLDFVYDVFGCSFKMDDGLILHLKNMISSHPDMDSQSFSFDLDFTNSWDKDNDRNSQQVISIMKNYINQAKNSISAMGIQEDKVNSDDFLRKNKTIIIDLSSLKPPLSSFATFVIIAKLIHQTNNMEGSEGKLIVMPNIEYFFDQRYLDRYVKPYLVDLFLDPLQKNNFGFMFLINNISQLHHNAFNYINNYMVLKTKQHYDVITVRNLLNLQEVRGQGVYSKSRKNTYQIEYLNQLKSDECLVLRDDLDQPFPVKIDLNRVSSAPILKYDALSKHMQKFGYDFQKTEDQIIKSMKKTIFEKDFHNHLFILEDIINFLRALSVTDTIGNISEHSIKEQLLKQMSNKYTAKNYNRRQIQKIRDDLFLLLKTHRYLIENHPKEAGGGESIRTSYSVGPQFQKALQDYFELQPQYSNKIDVEPIQDEQVSIENSIPKKEEIIEYFLPPKEVETEIKFESREGSPRALKNILSSYLIPEMILIDTKINSQRYKQAILSINKLIPNFLFKLYNNDYNVNGTSAILEKEIEDSVDYIVSSEIIPFDRQNLYNILNQIEVKNLNEMDLKQTAKEMYNTLYDFTQKTLKYLYKKEERDN